MLNEVWFPSNISCNTVQHFFCSHVSINKVALVWPRTLTLLRSSTRSKSSLRHEQQVVSPKIRDHYSSQISSLPDSSLYRTTCCIRLATQSNTIQQSWILQCWMMLHPFGRGVTAFLEKLVEPANIQNTSSLTNEPNDFGELHVRKQALLITVYQLECYL